MRMADPLKILFCVNAAAGPKRRDPLAWLRSTVLLKEHLPVILELREDRAEAIRKAIKEHSPDVVVAVGGDGTVNLVAGIVGGTGMPIGIIPTGSANGLATDLGIPMDPDQALRSILSRPPRPTDAILINGKDICVHLSDLGLNAQLIKHFDDSPARGMFTYARLSLKVLRNRKRLKVTVESDQGKIVRRAFMVVLANARKYGTGATINKEGAMDDGLFEVVLVRSFGFRELWASMSEKRRFDPKRIEVVQAREVEVNTGRKTHFQVDGDHKGRVRSVHAKILPGHLRLIHG